MLNEEILDELDRIFENLAAEAAMAKTADLIKVITPYFRRANELFAKLCERSAIAGAKDYWEFVREMMARAVFAMPENCPYVPVLIRMSKLNEIRPSLASAEMLLKMIPRSKIHSHLIIIDFDENMAKEEIKCVKLSKPK